METKKLLTVAEVALLLNIGRSLAYRLIGQGVIKSIKIGNARRVPPGEVEAYVHEQLQQCHVPTSKSTF